jgi:hypothetical protein
MVAYRGCRNRAPANSGGKGTGDGLGKRGKKAGKWEKDVFLTKQT